MSEREPLFRRGRLREPVGPRTTLHATLRVCNVAVSTGVGLAAAYRVVAGPDGVNILLAFVLGPFVWALVTALCQLPLTLLLRAVINRDNPGALYALLILNAAGVLFVYGGMVQPMQQADEVIAQRRAEAEAKLAQDMAAAQRKADAVEVERGRREEKIRQDDDEMQAWVAGLRAKGRSGPPGTVPPMVQLQDQGDVVRIVLTRTGSTVQIARIKSSADGDGLARCRMFAKDLRYVWRTRAQRLDWNKEYRLVLAPQCAEEFREAPLEFRIGRPREGTGWWTDTAIDDPKSWFEHG